MYIHVRKAEWIADAQAEITSWSLEYLILVNSYYAISDGGDQSYTWTKPSDGTKAVAYFFLKFHSGHFFLLNNICPNYGIEKWDYNEMFIEIVFITNKKFRAYLNHISYSIYFSQVYYMQLLWEIEEQIFLTLLLVTSV